RLLSRRRARAGARRARRARGARRDRPHPGGGAHRSGLDAAVPRGARTPGPARQPAQPFGDRGARDGAPVRRRDQGPARRARGRRAGRDGWRERPGDPPRAGRVVSAPRPAAPAIEARAAFDFIRYASVWEDADVLCEALGPVARGGRLLSIASAGDNVLALLTLGPAEVVAVDLSRAQLACVELRIAAFRMLADDELLEFLGFPAGAAAEDGGAAGDAGGRRDRRALASYRRRCYARLRGALSPGAAGFWDAHAGALERGPIHAGKFERYFHRFRRYVLPLVHRPATVAALSRSCSR